MTKKKLIAIVVAVVIVLGGIGGAIWGYKAYSANKKEVPVQSVAYVNWGYWGDTETSYGMVTNDSAQEIYVDDDESVERVFVEEGDYVKKGDPLLSYDMSELAMEMEMKSLDINTLQNDILQENYKLNTLKTTSPVDKTPPQIDEDKFESLYEQDVKNNDISEKDKKDKRIYNYLKKGALPFNATLNASGSLQYPAGTESDPYIYCCNKNVYAYGEFFNSIRPNSKDADGIYVRIIVPQKDAKGQVIVDGNGMPVADASLEIYQKYLDGGEIPADYDQEKMWYVFSGKERTPSDLAGQYRDEYLNELENWGEPDGYTKEELVQEIHDTEKLLKDLDIRLRRELLELQTMQKTASDGIIYAEVEGTVKSIGDADDSGAFLVIASDDGLYVSGTISELLLGDVKIGTVVKANSWESGMSFEATITEISQYPVSSNSWGEGNPNASYYSYTAYIEDSTALRNGEYVDLSIATNQTAEGEGIYLDKAYVREEDGRHYCMIADENGRLKKQYVQTGKTVYGSAIEIKSGLSNDDLIAFPYGKDVVEGAKTTEESEEYYY